MKTSIWTDLSIYQSRVRRSKSNAEGGCIFILQPLQVAFSPRNNSIRSLMREAS